MAVDLDGLSPKELDALISKAKQRKQTLAKRSSQAEVSKALEATARKHGWTLSELFGASRGTGAPKVAKAAKPAAAPKSRNSATKGTKVAAKYRHPETGQTWSGRGILPKWMTEEIAKGRKREDFAI
jgi:DNA-binding protein H-NS